LRHLVSLASGPHSAGHGGWHGEETDGAAIEARVLGVPSISARQSSRREKQRILDAFMRVCGYHRKYVIGLLNRPLMEPQPRRRLRRAPRYSDMVIDVLAEL
jgi:hypothetical protein